MKNQEDTELRNVIVLKQKYSYRLDKSLVVAYSFWRSCVHYYEMNKVRIDKRIACGGLKTNIFSHLLGIIFCILAWMAYQPIFTATLLNSREP